MNRNMEIPAIAALATVLALSACSGGGPSSVGGAGYISSPATSGSTSAGSESGGSSSASYSIGGTVTGLGGPGLTLQLNGSVGLAVAADGTFTFPTGLPGGTAYAVTVSTQPSVSREICGVVNGSGSVGTASVTDVAVYCSTVIGFLYQLADNQINAYGISAGTGLPIAFGSTPQIGSVPAQELVVGPGGNHVYALANGDPNGPPPAEPQNPSSISTYAVNSDSGILTPVGAPISAGDQPVFLATASSGFLFLLNGNDFTGQVLNPVWTLAEYSLDPNSGTPTLIGTALTMPPNTITSIAVTADGRFLYVLNGPTGVNPSSPSTLTAYAIDPSTGTLTQGSALTVSGNAGTLTLDPQGRFLYLIDAVWTDYIGTSGILLSYSIDPQSGALTPVGAGTPVSTNGLSLAPDPTGQYLYLTETQSPGGMNGTIQALSVASTGSISTIGDTPVMYSPYSLQCDPSGEFVYVLDTNTQAIETFMISTNPGTAGQLIPGGPSQPASLGAFVFVE
jgi:6-phosphogluconolactonase (cycloisomerase 2 family)